MNTLDVLEKYSRLCDELDTFMQEENRDLRAGGSTEAFAERKQLAVVQLTDALTDLRAAAPADRAQLGAARETRDRVLQKLLKLLLLSRESEQLLLRAMSPSSRKPAPVRPGGAQLRNIYQAHAA
jgi:hypothetical protein